MKTIGYFKHSKLLEHDQESFLVWSFNLLSSKVQPEKEFAQGLIKLLCGDKLKESEKAIEPINKHSIAYRQIGNQKGKIDIVVLFSINAKKYVLVIEHKTLSRKGNPFDFYKEIIEDHFHSLEPYEAIYGFLDPFEIYNEKSMKEKYKVDIQYTGLRYFDYLNNYIQKHKEDDSMGISFVNDYFNNFFLDDEEPIASLSNRFEKFSKILFRDYSILEPIESKSVSLALGEKRIELCFDGAWNSGNYYIEFVNPAFNNVRNKEVFTKVGKRTQKYILFSSGKLKTITNLKEMIKEVFVNL